MWSLKIVAGAELADKLLPEVRLPQPLQRFTIGRDPANSWPIADRMLAISGRHCEVIATPDGPALRDLSTNGTFVNGSATRLAGVHLLRDGDRFELGPFRVEISGPPMVTRPGVFGGASASTPAAAETPRNPGIRDTAPQRGGDPAAMAAMAARGQGQGGNGRAGLTEILRAATPSDHTDSELTKIRLAPVPVPVPVPAPAPAQVPTSVALRGESPPLQPPLQPAASPAATAAAVTQALARGLGLPMSALDGQDPLHLVQQIALTARAATAALQQVFEHQAEPRRVLDGLQPPTPAPRDNNPLRVGLKLDPAVLALALAKADPVSVMQRSADELCEHEDHLLGALAAQRGSLPG